MVKRLRIEAEGATIAEVVAELDRMTELVTSTSWPAMSYLPSSSWSFMGGSMSASAAGASITAMNLAGDRVELPTPAGWHIPDGGEVLERHVGPTGRVYWEGRRLIVFEDEFEPGRSDGPVLAKPTERIPEFDGPEFAMLEAMPLLTTARVVICGQERALNTPLTENFWPHVQVAAEKLGYYGTENWELRDTNGEVIEPGRPLSELVTGTFYFNPRPGVGG